MAIEGGGGSARGRWASSTSVGRRWVESGLRLGWFWGGTGGRLAPFPR